MKKHIAKAVLLTLGIFGLSYFITHMLLHAVSTESVAVHQLILKGMLILLSLFAIRFFLGIPFTKAGFCQSKVKIRKTKIILSGMAVGSLITILIFFSPAEGMTNIKQLNPLEFLLIIVFWSSVSEEVLIRGFLQSYLKPFDTIKVNLFGQGFSLSVVICASVFCALHLTLLLTPTDYYTILFILLGTFMLGLLAGAYREQSNSMIPSIITHMSFNIGGMITGIILTIIYTVITGEMPEL